MKLLHSLLASTLLATAWLPAHAITYTAFIPEQSQLTFSYRQMGVSLDGSFPAFQGSLTFDPTAPEQGRAEVSITVAEIDTGLPDANAEVTKAEWFAVAQHPVAHFETTAIRALGDQRYEVDGTLTIKGIQRPLTLPATFTETDGRGVFAGQFTLNRSDFKIGEGMWAGTDLVANEVDVRFELAARPAP